MRLENNKILQSNYRHTFYQEFRKMIRILLSALPKFRHKIFAISASKTASLEETYKYLEVAEADGVKNDVIKTKPSTTCKQRIHKVLCS